MELILLGMVFLTKLLKRTVGEDNKHTEMFMTGRVLLHVSAPKLTGKQANRSVRTGLTASAVVSVSSPSSGPAVLMYWQSWLWSTALLGSSIVGYTNGVSGPFWFAAGCSPMIVLWVLLLWKLGGEVVSFRTPKVHSFAVVFSRTNYPFQEYRLIYTL